MIGPTPWIWARSAPQAREPGPVTAYVTSIAGFGTNIPLTHVIDFEVNRKADAIGTWSIVVPVDDRLDQFGDPMQNDIVSGWTISILQDANSPYGASGRYLVKDGVVERREYQLEHGGALLSLSGSFSEVSLTREQIHDPLSYEDENVGVIAQDLAGYPVNIPTGITSTLKVDFNMGTKYAALLTVGELARLTLRENWDGVLEFVRVDGAPDSGITLLTAEQAGPELVG